MEPKTESEIDPHEGFFDENDTNESSSWDELAQFTSTDSESSIAVS